MCLPVALAASAVSAAGTMVGGIQSMQQGAYEAKAYRQNARLEIEAARDSIDRGEDESRSFWRDVSRLKGDQIAGMAANGIDVDFGAGARVQRDTAMIASEDASSLRRNIEERTRGHVINAQNFVSEAKAAKYRSKQAMVGSVFQAGSSLMSGFQQQKLLKAKLAV